MEVAEASEGRAGSARLALESVQVRKTQGRRVGRNHLFQSPLVKRPGQFQELCP